MSDGRVLETTLELDTIDELFVAPTISPLAVNYRPHSHTSAIEFIAGELHANTSVKRVKATFIVSSAEAARAAGLDLPGAIRRFSAAKLGQTEQGLHGVYWRGRRALAIAIVALFVFIGLGTIVYGYDGLLPEIVAEGLFVAGWVALWVPLEMWFFHVWRHRLDRRIWRVVSDMEVTVVTADPDQVRRGRPGRENESVPG